MRILWVKVGGLFPVNTGGRRRSFEIISELSRRHEVIVVTTHGPNDDPSLLRSALPSCKEVISVPHAIPKQGTGAFVRALAQSWFSALPVDVWRCRAEAMRERVREVMLRKPGLDVCVADFLVAVPNVQGLWNGNGPPVVLFEHNVESQIWKRMRDNEPNPLKRLLLDIESKKMQSFETDACAWSRRTIAVSEKDGAQLSKLAPGAEIRAMPTGVDINYFAPNAESTNHPDVASSLVFTGAMDWFPNEDGLLDFCAQTLPLIRRERPEVTLTIVGRNPPASIRALADPGRIEVTGTVEDVRPFLARGAVFIVPLRIGGGTRLKIFEALAMGKAVVSTTIGAEGLPVTSGEHLILADSPSEFARATLQLLNDGGRRRALGDAGRSLVETQFAWPMVARNFEQQLAEVTSHAR